MFKIENVLTVVNTFNFHFLLVLYWFSEDHLTQYNPFFTSIISSDQITRAHYDDIIINNGHCSKEEHTLADVSTMMISELRHYCNHYFFF